MVCIEKRPYTLYGRLATLHFRYLTCLLDRGHIISVLFYIYICTVDYLTGAALGTICSNSCTADFVISLYILFFLCVSNFLNRSLPVG